MKENNYDVHHAEEKSEYKPNIAYISELAGFLKKRAGSVFTEEDYQSAYLLLEKMNQNEAGNRSIIARFMKELDQMQGERNSH
ncbi:hypothetical protein [Bacillus testis]|uniref:hypothetical protein n=1 Tax=Bacillus testis TaxID=1622072 RepID=UPI00067F6584|nr:hypothetical protein [Bacillus testis]